MARAFHIAYVYPHGEPCELDDSWGAENLEFCGRYDGLRYVRLNALGAFCLSASDHYELPAQERKALFRLLPNHDIVLASGIPDPADRAMLELMATQQSDHVWKLDSELLLTHAEAGSSIADLRKYLADHAESIPENIQVFLNELEAKLGACHGAEDSVLLEWTDEATARLIATSAATRKLCLHAGGNWIVVRKSDYRPFSRAVKKHGYVIPVR